MPPPPDQELLPEPGVCLAQNSPGKGDMFWHFCAAIVNIKAQYWTGEVPSSVWVERGYTELTRIYT